MANIAYPLNWPEGWKRTPRRELTYSRFNTYLIDARDNLIDEIEKMGGYNIVISSNLRADEYSNYIYHARHFKEPDDAGIAVYFRRNGIDTCIACDRYYNCFENMQALRKTVEAMRNIERWGASEILNKAFSGHRESKKKTNQNKSNYQHQQSYSEQDFYNEYFKQTSTPNKKHWRVVLGVSMHINNIEEVKIIYKKLCSIHHPDKGGSNEKMKEINVAWAEAQLAL